MSTLTWLPSFDVDVAVNLAADEYLLGQVDRGERPGFVRCWEPTSYAVILGRSNDPTREVDVAACRAAGIPVYRRCSGGGTVVIGPGCLCWAIARRFSLSEQQRGIQAMTASILTPLAEQLGRLATDSCLQGISDLAVGPTKVGGNAQRWLRQALLHHGTLLYDFDLPLIGRYLQLPSRQPEYRQQRSHREFVRNFPASSAELSAVFREAWPITAPEEALDSATCQAISELAQTRYQPLDLAEL